VRAQSTKLKVEDARVVFCEALAPAPGGKACACEAGSGSSILVRANVLDLDSVF
jgi:hypothetical protein